MSADDALNALATACGILPEFYGLDGRAHSTSVDTQRALLRANGFAVDSAAEVRDSLDALRHATDDRWFPEEIIVPSGTQAPQNFGLGATWQVIAEDGSVVCSGAAADAITLPPLPAGIYDLVAEASGRVETVTVLATPDRAPSVADLTGTARLWGISHALYGLRSARNGGMGDFADLARLGETGGRTGAGFLGVNPLHAMGYANTEAISPYSPSHRGYLDAGYIALDAIPGLEAVGLAGLETNDPFAAPRASDQVDYAGQRTAHRAALEQLYGAFLAQAPASVRDDHARFVAAGGEDLQRFMQFEATSEHAGPDWRQWPAGAQPPDPDRAAFHGWLQWVADRQLGDAQARAVSGGMALGLYLDLAVGPRRDGAESWCEHDAIASGLSIGAPPDHLSPGGQNWALAAFSPRKLKALKYAPLRRILSQTMRHAGVVRIDHVLGLNRSFWIPDDGSAGAYIGQPFAALLAVVKIAAHQNRTAVIGEDLGLVPDGFRDTMRASGIYGYSVMQYEKADDGSFRDPRYGPTQVLSCFATHDTPTVKGYETGGDIGWWQKLGWIDPTSVDSARAARATDVDNLRRLAADSGHEAGDLAQAVDGMLATSAADLVCVQLDDILDNVEAQNLPGTTDAHPNWQRKYEVPVEALSHNPRLKSLGPLMERHNRHSVRQTNGKDAAHDQ